VRYRAILFDFDGVLLESEYAGNRHLAGYLTTLGHPITPEETMAQFMGLAGHDFFEAVEQWISGPLPADFHAARDTEEQRAIIDGIAAVAGAIAFVRDLPPDLPRAVCSSSPTRWIAAHLAHLGLADAFADHIYSGREHVANGKPSPDIYLHAAGKMGVPIGECVAIEDSPVGARSAVASGAFVIGLCAGLHCGVDHAEKLLAIGVDAIAANYDDVRRLVA
jgi:HAD superfamily hydrolase (TIGR01509 family)